MNLGVYAAPLTPFDDHGSLALERVPAYVGFLLGAGVDGLLALGTNGEFASLTLAERQRAVEAFVAATAGRVPVVANVGATAAPDAARLARHAREAGCAGVAVLPPYYFPLTDPGFVAFARSVADAFGAPVYLYNIPRYTGYAIPAGVVAEAVAAGWARGLKDSSQDMAYFADVRERAPAAELFIGSDTTLIEGLDAGADGVVSGMANTYPELIVGAYRAHRAGSDPTPWRERVLWLRRLFARYPYLAATRVALRLRGIDAGPPRPPLTDLAANELPALEGELRQFHARPPLGDPA